MRHLVFQAVGKTVLYLFRRHFGEYYTPRQVGNVNSTPNSDILLLFALSHQCGLVMSCLRNKVCYLSLLSSLLHSLAFKGRPDDDDAEHDQLSLTPCHDTLKQCNHGCTIVVMSDAGENAYEVLIPSLK